MAGLNERKGSWDIFDLTSRFIARTSSSEKSPKKSY